MWTLDDDGGTRQCSGEVLTEEQGFGAFKNLTRKMIRIHLEQALHTKGKIMIGFFSNPGEGLTSPMLPI